MPQIANDSKYGKSVDSELPTIWHQRQYKIFTSTNILWLPTKFKQNVELKTNRKIRNLQKTNLNKAFINHYPFSPFNHDGNSEKLHIKIKSC